MISKKKPLLIIAWASIIFNFHFLFFNPIHAQDSNRIALQVDAGHFFQNNEFFGRHAEGYTLPGFYLQPKMIWHVDPRVTFEVGAHWLHFWGAHNYPAGTTYGIWPLQDDSLSTPIHLLPWIRTDVYFNDFLTLTLGNLHNNICHRLPLPLYNPERQYAADPEAGVQLQACYKHLQADVWIDWREFIWQRSNRQEQFFFGTSLKGNLYFGDHWTLYLPMHFIAQHIGGQGLAEHKPVQTHFNAAAGLGVHYSQSPWNASAECYAIGYTRKGISEVPFNKGRGVYPTLRIGYDNTTLDVGYWQGHGFLPLLGSQLFSNIGETSYETNVFHRCHLLTVGARYEWHQFRYCNISVEGRYYNYLVTENASQYSFGIFLDLHPTLTLLR